MSELPPSDPNASEAPDDDPKPRDVAAILADLTASRIAHEVVGPIGAINNGLELIQELGDDAGGDATALVAASAKAAGTRLQFYRMAYGRAGFGVTNLADLRAVAAALFDGAPRHDLAWPLPPVLPSIGVGVGRLVLILAEIAKEALPRGGVVRISISEETVDVSAENGEVGLPEPMPAVLSGSVGASDLSPGTVHGALAQHFATDIGWTISVDTAPEGLTLKASMIG